MGMVLLSLMLTCSSIHFGDSVAIATCKQQTKQCVEAQVSTNPAVVSEACKNK